MAGDCFLGDGVRGGSLVFSGDVALRSVREEAVGEPCHKTAIKV